MHLLCYFAGTPGTLPAASNPKTIRAADNKLGFLRDAMQLTMFTVLN